MRRAKSAPCRQAKGRGRTAGGPAGRTTSSPTRAAHASPGQWCSRCAVQREARRNATHCDDLDPVAVAVARHGRRGPCDSAIAASVSAAPEAVLDEGVLGKVERVGDDVGNAGEVEARRAGVGRGRRGGRGGRRGEGRARGRAPGGEEVGDLRGSHKREGVSEVLAGREEEGVGRRGEGLTAARTSWWTDSVT